MSHRPGRKRHKILRASVRIACFVAMFTTYVAIIATTNNWYSLKWSRMNIYASYKDPLSIVHHFVLAASLSAVAALLEMKTLRTVATICWPAVIGYLLGSLPYLMPLTTPPYYPTDTYPGAIWAFIFGLAGLVLGIIRSQTRADSKL